MKLDARIWGLVVVGLVVGCGGKVWAQGATTPTPTVTVTPAPTMTPTVMPTATPAPTPAPTIAVTATPAPSTGVNIDAVVAVLCVVLGFVLSEGFTWFRERRNDKAQAESVRTILKTEIELNIKTLRKFWLPPQKRGDLVRWLLISFCPEFERVAFESQLPLLARALNEQKVLRVYQFYYRLDHLEAIKVRLPKMKDHGIQSKEYKDLAERYIQLITQLLAEGNPLAPHPTTPHHTPQRPAARDEGETK